MCSLFVDLPTSWKKLLFLIQKYGNVLFPRYLLTCWLSRQRGRIFLRSSILICRLSIWSSLVILVILLDLIVMVCVQASWTSTLKVDILFHPLWLSEKRRPNLLWADKSWGWLLIVALSVGKENGDSIQWEKPGNKTCKWRKYRRLPALMFILQTVDDSKGKIRSCLECYQILRGRNFLEAGLLEAFT